MLHIKTLNYIEVISSLQEGANELCASWLMFQNRYEIS